MFALVLLAAAVHAGWNAILKGAGDPMASVVLVAVAAAVISAAALPFMPALAPPSWAFAAGSAVLQSAYFLLLGRAYATSEMSLVYPVMRGASPLLTALLSMAVIGEVLVPGAWAGVGLISLGVLALAVGARARDARAGLLLALANAAVIASYTIVDGVGARLSGAPIAYTLWVFLLTGILMGGWAALDGRQRGFELFGRYWLRGLAAGAGALASYAAALWAMTLAPVAMVAALRETSILFGMAISAIVLKERTSPMRLAAAGIITLGALTLRLA